MTVAQSDRGTRHGNDGRFERTAETAERDAAAARLRMRGLTFAQIADELGYVDHTGARRAVHRALKAIVAEPAEDLRQMELVRLDAMWQACLAVLEARHFTISNGRLIRIGEHPIEDDAPVLAAVDRMLKIQDRRAKLLGLDAPVKTNVTITTEIDAQIQELAAQFERQRATP